MTTHKQPPDKQTATPKPVISSTTENVLHVVISIVGVIFFFGFGMYVLNQAKKGNWIFNNPSQAFTTMLFSCLGLAILISKYQLSRFKTVEGIKTATQSSYFLVFLECLKVFCINSTASLMWTVFFIAFSMVSMK